MYIAVDPEGTLHVASKTDQALADLEGNFEACDRAMDAVAIVLARDTPTLAASVRNVAVREGAHQVKICTAARVTTRSLRGAAWDFVRQAEALKDDIVELAEAVEQAVEYRVDSLQQAAAQVGRVGEKVAHRAYGIAEMMTGSSKTLRGSDH